MIDSSQEAKREEVVAEARTWVGTPFRHLGRIKGLGVDCVGLVICVARAVGFFAVDSEWYPQRPIYNQFSQAIDSQTAPVDFDIDLWRADPAIYRGNLKLGDLLKFMYGREQVQHIGIVTQIYPQVRFVHAYAIVSNTEEAYFEKSWSARFRGARRYRELA